MTQAAQSRAQTGIEGLDHILVGGLPRNRVYLVQGDPGVGKTTLALQFLLEGIRNGETVLYVTLSETAEELKAVADSHGWDISKVHVYEQLVGEEELREDLGREVFRGNLRAGPRPRQAAALAGQDQAPDARLVADLFGRQLVDRDRVLEPGPSRSRCPGPAVAPSSGPGRR